MVLGLGKIKKGITQMFGKKDPTNKAQVGTVKKQDPNKKVVYDKLDDDAKLGLHMASQAYEAPDTRKDYGGYKYKRDDSDKQTAVYHNPKSNKTYIGYRGTADLDDVIVDTVDKSGNIVSGTQRSSKRFKKMLEKHKTISKKYGNKASVSGHSLGGNISDYVARETGAKAQVFNTGRGIDGEALADKAMCSLPKSMKPSYCGLTTRHRISGDPISIADRFTGYGKTTTYKNPAGSKMTDIAKAHSLDNFYK